MVVKKEITGSLQIKNNVFYAVLNLYDEKGKRKPKWISTGLLVRGNKRNAEEILNQLKGEYTIKAEAPKGRDLAFLAYLKTWLEIKKASLQETTYEGYSAMIYGKITQYFEPLELKLEDVHEWIIEEFFQFL